MNYGLKTLLLLLSIRAAVGFVIDSIFCTSYHNRPENVGDEILARIFEKHRWQNERKLTFQDTNHTQTHTHTRLTTHISSISFYLIFVVVVFVMLKALNARM